MPMTAKYFWSIRARDFWLNGQEGPGFYRQLGGENEKLEPGRIPNLTSFASSLLLRFHLHIVARRVAQHFQFAVAGLAGGDFGAGQISPAICPSRATRSRDARSRLARQASMVSVFLSLVQY